MATRKKKTESLNDQEWPKIEKGSHSTRIEHENGHIELVHDWEALANDINTALAQYESTNVQSLGRAVKRKKSSS